MAFAVHLQVRGALDRCLHRPIGPQARRLELHQQTRGAAGRASTQEQAVLRGPWHDGAPGAITFLEFVARKWLPSANAARTGGLL